MDEWVERAMRRWPNVPALFGWLGLNRRGQWLIQDEIIRHERTIQTINRNYAVDEYGRWFFQNGPQRGFVSLASTPWILRHADAGEALATHTGLRVLQLHAAYLDEDGRVLLQTDHGPGEIESSDLGWLLESLRRDNSPISESDLADALAVPSGAMTQLMLVIGGISLPVRRLNTAAVPDEFEFERVPKPRPHERISTRIAD